ncbi:response regulator transcription factor [Neobacillus niacini]|uniref:response regulator n=1 Tax=Neobacillus niacini TaxID=86668 RepID=UPI0021CB0F8C|nr:response regulator transcription factor [Neobacillus niacini]MCM3766727.1 response regulator transcription factor [Neobacillus niacini]
MITIVIAEEQEMLLGAIESLLNLEDDMKVVGQASNGEEAIALVRRLQPDVCIMDIEMPEKSGLEAAEALKSVGCKVIILTTFARKGYTERAVKADVRGYLLKDSPSEELASSIRSIMDGERIFSSELIEEASGVFEGEMGGQLENPSIHQTSIQKRNTIGMVRNYFSTIMEKIKQPTG